MWSHSTQWMGCAAATSAPVWLVHARVAALLAVAGYACLPRLAVVVEAGVGKASHRRVALGIVDAAVVAAMAVVFLAASASRADVLSVAGAAEALYWVGTGVQLLRDALGCAGAGNVDARGALAAAGHSAGLHKAHWGEAARLVGAPAQRGAVPVLVAALALRAQVVQPVAVVGATAQALARGAAGGPPLGVKAAKAPPAFAVGILHYRPLELAISTACVGFARLAARR